MSLISIKNLTISFKQNQNVVNNVNIEIPKGKTVAIVGESGSGKTLSALSILKLLPGNANINSGSIIFKEKDLLQLPLNEIEKIRGNKISTIFQEPMSSLNPLHTIDKQIKEMITTHYKKNIEELNDSVFGDKDGEYSLAYNDFIAPLTKAVQELSEKNEALEKRIEELEN